MAERIRPQYKGGQEKAGTFVTEAGQMLEDKAADQGAHQAQRDVDHAALAALVHDLACQPAGKGAKEYPAENRQ